MIVSAIYHIIMTFKLYIYIYATDVMALYMYMYMVQCVRHVICVTIHTVRHSSRVSDIS